ncbi:MAG TPA: phosphoglycerate kinase [Candidatus Saccharimonadales bacterium]|nr:phosphoglycerate kinase [Candidatus Saccharimonadales bacterium]
MMAFHKKTVRNVPLEHQTVLLRADYNVPLKPNGTIADDFRILHSIPTVEFLLKAGCKVVVCSHLGRPEGKRDPSATLKPVAKRLSKLLGKPVTFVDDCVGDKVKVAVKKMKAGDVVLLENLRYYKEEEKNDPHFAKRLAEDSGARYFIQDGFGVVHRAHASTDAITHFLPSVSGLLLEKEVTTILGVMSKPKRPLVAVLGGAKVSDKIKVIDNFIGIADQLIIGGAMANTFLKYRGYDVGKSKVEDGEEKTLDHIYELASKKVGAAKVDDFLLLPTDVAVAPEIGPKQRRKVVSIDAVGVDEYILDLGTDSIKTMLQHMRGAKTVVWNGTLGMAEYVVFAYGSAKLALALAEHESVFSLIGGGDTADFVVHWDPKKGKSFGHVSTGGGASLDLMAGEVLPGVAALMDK